MRSVRPTHPRTCTQKRTHRPPCAARHSLLCSLDYPFKGHRKSMHWQVCSRNKPSTTIRVRDKTLSLSPPPLFLFLCDSVSLSSSDSIFIFKSHQYKCFCLCVGWCGSCVCVCACSMCVSAWACDIFPGTQWVTQCHSLDKVDLSIRATDNRQQQQWTRWRQPPRRSLLLRREPQPLPSPPPLCRFMLASIRSEVRGQINVLTAVNYNRHTKACLSPWN